MKVAFATCTGNQIDEHFGRAGQFAIYDITPECASLVELRRVAEGDFDSEVVVTRGMGSLHDEAIDTKIGKLADVKIVFFTEIGGPSAAKLVRRGIMPLKGEHGTSIEAEAAKLVATMRERPAPWMKRALAEELEAPAPVNETSEEGRTQP
jgi:nitrogen fixation protein NifX